MILTPVQQTQRVVGAAYARRFAHPATLALVEALEHENAGLRESIIRKQRFLTRRSGRFVFYQSMSGVLSAVVITLVLSWYFYSMEGACLRDGIQLGKTDGVQHEPLGDVVSEPCKQNQDPILARFRGPEARPRSDAVSAPPGGTRRP